MWLTPTDEELFKKYNPELQKRSLENRYERQKEFDDFVTKLKEYSKSDKPIWVIQTAEGNKAREAKAANLKTERLHATEAERLRKEEQREELRRQAGLSR